MYEAPDHTADHWQRLLTDQADDLTRELDKARDTLDACLTYLERYAEANAALHCADRVMYSPLHARVDTAIAGLDEAISRYRKGDGDG
ncbi:MAG: hypothetical protein ACRDOJ_05070 [Nocardioidaceae bacterium]